MTSDISTAPEERLKWMVAGATVECFRGLLSNHAPCQVCHDTGRVFALPDAVREYDYEPTDDRWAYLEAALEVGVDFGIGGMSVVTARYAPPVPPSDTLFLVLLRAMAYALEARGTTLGEAP